MCVCACLGVCLFVVIILLHYRQSQKQQQNNSPSENNVMLPMGEFQTLIGHESIHKVLSYAYIGQVDRPPEQSAEHKLAQSGSHGGEQSGALCWRP